MLPKYHVLLANVVDLLVLAVIWHQQIMVI